MEQNPAAIVTTCLGYTGTAAKAERLAGISSDKWLKVMELAHQHNVETMLAHHLKPLNLPLAVNVADALKQAHLKQALRNILLYREMGKLLQLLHEKNIAVIALKGAYLAEAVYDDLGLRGMSDIDLLVKKEDLPRVERELLSLRAVPEDCNRGVGRHNHHFGYRLPASGIRVEVHWTIMGTDYPCRIDVAGMWHRARPVTLANSPARALAPEDLLLHLCLHVAKDIHHMHLRMVCDIGEVLRHHGADLEWSVLLDRARRWGVIRPVYMVLRLAQELLKAAVPADRLASMRPDDFDEAYYDLLREHVLAGQGQGDIAPGPMAAKLWEARGVRRKLSLLARRILLPREMMAGMYPVPAHSRRIYLYYPVRLKDILVRHSTSVWRLARGDAKSLAAAGHTNKVTALRDWLMSG